MIREMWCKGCQQVKGEMDSEMIKTMSMTLGCCPKCDTQWVWRDKIVN